MISKVDWQRVGEILLTGIEREDLLERMEKEMKKAGIDTNDETQTDAFETEVERRITKGFKTRLSTRKEVRRW